LSGAPTDRVCELLAQSLVAWRVAGTIERASDGVLLIGGNAKDIRIELFGAPSVVWKAAAMPRQANSEKGHTP